MKIREPGELSGTISSFGPRWAVLDGIEFTRIRGRRIPDDWVIYDPKSDAHYDSASARRADEQLPTATMIPRPFGKVMSLCSGANFTFGEWTRSVVIERRDDGTTLSRNERPGYEIELLTNADDFVLEATGYVTEDDGTVVVSGIRVLITAE